VELEGVVDGSSYPIRTSLEAPAEVARWRPFFAWLVAIPHFIVLGVLGSVVGFLVFIAWFAILFTKRIPKGIVDFTVMYLRYQWRVMAYGLGLTEPYPPFEFEMETDDDGRYPAMLELDPADELSRGLIWVKWLLIIPHGIVLLFVYFAACVAWFFGAVAVLFTGRWPDGVRDFLVGTGRWTNRVSAYTYLLTDEYPPFALR
jgi:hypothetical protein